MNNKTRKRLYITLTFGLFHKKNKRVGQLVKFFELINCPIWYKYKGYTWEYGGYTK